ncbi:MAG TPA: terminase TerL endonuclease subunit [Actinomycetota bacterium]|nr:terminase TerL endonuclease subunit [Actinomycetota bacterium]
MGRTPPASSGRPKRDRLPPKSTPVCRYVFDELRCNKRGDHYCRPRAEQCRRFFEEVLVHTKGRFARTAFVLAGWQWRDIISPAFGSVRWSKELRRYVRQYRTVWIEIARKNGKSELLAAVALYMLIADAEESAEIYGAAKNRDQARKVWDVAERMVRLSPPLAKQLKLGKIKVNRQEKKIIYEPTGSYYQVVTADAAGELGHNPHCVVFDEVLTQPGPDLWEAFSTAMDTREQPMMWAATTSGKTNTFAAGEHAYSVKVAANPRLDPSRLAYICSVPQNANVWLERNWKKANPALGQFKSIEGMRTQAKEARNDPRKESAFRQFHCNQWGHEEELWIPPDRYDASAGMVVEEKLVGKLCYGALHLAASTDITAMVLTFPEGEGYEVVARFWVPEARLEDLRRRTEGESDVWVREGRLAVTPGDMIDYDEISAEIHRLRDAFNFEHAAYHRWGMAQLATELEEEGLEVTPMATTMTSLSGPTKDLERLVYAGAWHHGGHPVLRWMFANVGIRKDSDQNIKIDPKLSKDNVSGAIASAMSLALMQRLEEDVVDPVIIVGGGRHE